MTSSPTGRLDVAGLRVRRWRTSDAAALSAAVTASEEHLSRWLPWAAGYGRETAEQFLADAEQAWAERTAFQYAVLDGGCLVGGVGLHVRAADWLEIGYWVHVDRVRRGIGTRAAAAVTAAGLALPEVGRVEIHHDVGNAASAAVPRRLGYRRTGERPRDPAVASETGRTAVWTLTRSEYPGSAARRIVAGPAA